MKTVKKVVSTILGLAVFSGLLLVFIGGSSRYQRNLDEIEGDTEIDISAKWIERKYLNLYYHHKVNDFNRERKSAKKGGVVFLGDSITDLMDVSVYYPSLKAVNRGISGDTTRGVLNRMDTVYDMAPSVIVLLIGVNDLMNELRTPENIAISYEQILSELRDELPEVQIVCQSVYPCYDGAVYKAAYLKEDIVMLNTYIQTLAEQYGCIYADTYSVLTDENGLMNPEYCEDGVHPVGAGYEAAKDYIGQILEAISVLR